MAVKTWNRWSVAHELILEIKWKQGMPLREIAVLIGKTPSAVAGKLNRMGLFPRKTFFDG